MEESHHSAKPGLDEEMPLLEQLVSVALELWDNQMDEHPLMLIAVTESPNGNGTYIMPTSNFKPSSETMAQIGEAITGIGRTMRKNT